MNWSAPPRRGVLILPDGHRGEDLAGDASDGGGDFRSPLDAGGNRRLYLDTIHFYNTGHFFPGRDGFPFTSLVHHRQTPIAITLNPISLVYFCAFNRGWAAIQIFDLFVHFFIIMASLADGN